jgi:hypothetical protein
MLVFLPCKFIIFNKVCRGHVLEKASLNRFDCYLMTWGSLDNSVCIATRYGLEGPGIESWWGKIFRIYPDRLRGPPSVPYNGYRVFPGGKGGRGVMLTTHPLLVPRLRKIWAIPPLTLSVLLDLLRGSLSPYNVRLKVALYRTVNMYNLCAWRYKIDFFTL